MLKGTANQKNRDPLRVYHVCVARSYPCDMSYVSALFLYCFSFRVLVGRDRVA